MTTHELKTLPEYFETLVSGVKTFEIRVNDRNFKVGDKLRLREYSPPTRYDLSKPTGKGFATGAYYTGREIERLVTCIVGPKVGDFQPLTTGWVVMGLGQQPETPPTDKTNA